jgi:DNA-binding GntR family transcriptional regulator
MPMPSMLLCTVQEMSVEEIEELYPLLNLLESYALELAFPLLQIQIPELESMNEAFYLKRYSPYEATFADCEFHHKLIELCKKQIITVASLKMLNLSKSQIELNSSEALSINKKISKPKEKYENFDGLNFA